MDHGSLRNTRVCKTCGKKQIGKYIHADLNITWSNYDDQE